MMKKVWPLLLLSVLMALSQHADWEQGSVDGHPDQQAGTRIESSLDQIINNPDAAIHSNPLEYIHGKKNAYDDILAQGEVGLAYMIKELKNSNESGLKEWVMAKACVDLLGERNPVKDWSTGKEWINRYNEGGTYE